jgi:hypothetical protein
LGFLRCFGGTAHRRDGQECFVVHQLIYLVGLVVVVMAILAFLGIR